MADRTIKPDDTHDLVLQNNHGASKIEVNEDDTIVVTSGGDIVLDADGADVTLKDGGTTFAVLKQVSGDLVIQPTTSKQIILNDQAGNAALTVDTSNQNVSINNGNIVMGTAGKGIDFAAQTVSSATGTTPDTSAGDEVLNHYETGTWTAQLADGSGNNMTMEAAKTTGYYTKVGNLVTVSGYFGTSSLGSATGDIRITGLPFAVYNNASAYAGGGVAYGNDFNLSTAGDSVSYWAVISSAYMILMVWDATTGETAMQASEWTASGKIMMGFSYRAA